jgi:hypothetical protein
MPARRFPPPWSVEELDACSVVGHRELDDALPHLRGGSYRSEDKHHE